MDTYECEDDTIVIMWLCEPISADELDGEGVTDSQTEHENECGCKQTLFYA